MTRNSAPVSTVEDLQEVCRHYKDLSGSYLELVPELREARSPERNQPLLAKGEVDALRSALERFRVADCTPRLRVAVVGAPTTGKSALVNALVGSSLLPESDQPCSLVPTIVRQSKTGREAAYLRYLSNPLLQDLLRAYAQRSESDGWPTDARAAADVTEAQVDLLVRSLPQRADQQDARALFKALRDPDVSAWVNGKDEDGLMAAANPESVRDLMVRSGHRSERFVLDAIIREVPDFVLGEELDLIDLPGAGSRDVWAQEAVFRHLRAADAVILVADGGLGDAEHRLLDLILQRAGQQVERIFVVLSRMDRQRQQTGEALRRAYGGLEQAWRQLFGDAPLRMFYTSARHAEAVRKTHAVASSNPSGESSESPDGVEPLDFAPTHHEQVDRLLSHVKDGGLPFLARSLTNFLKEDATRLRKEQLSAGWRELIDRAQVAIKPAAGRAGMLISERARGAAERGDKIIADLEDNTRKHLKGLRRDVEKIVSFLSDGTNDLLSRLKALAFAACTEALRDLTPEDKKESAREIVRRVVPGIRETFEELCIHAVLEFNPVQQFCEGCRTRLGSTVKVFEEIKAGTGDTLPELPPEPSEILKSCLELRISESLRTHGRGSPHRPADEITQFGRFEEAFVEDVRKFQNRQARQLIADVSEFLTYYLEWHLNRFEKRFFAFLRTLRSPEFVAGHSEVFEALTADSEGEKEQQRLDGLSRLADRLEQLARAGAA